MSIAKVECFKDGQFHRVVWVDGGVDLEGSSSSRGNAHGSAAQGERVGRGHFRTLSCGGMGDVLVSWRLTEGGGSC